MMRKAAKAVAILIAALGMAACDPARGGDAAPPRATDKAPSPSQKSLIAVPVNADIGPLRLELERSVPRTLWTINKRERRCIKPQRVKLLGERFNITPPIACTIVGRVTRGALKLRGEGREIIVDMPVTARVSARDVGGVLKGETATASAMVQARIVLDLAPDWRMQGKARIRYGWTKTPGIDFLGQRITFTEQADRELAPVIRDVETKVNREIARIAVRDQAADIWRQSFTALSLNRQNPAVWLRVTPQRILYGGYVMRGQQLTLNLGVEALTESFVGPRPPDPDATPLPNLVAEKPQASFDVRIPVIADYSALEPVIARALAKRSARPFDLPTLGLVDARFGAVTAYGAPGGRIAVGIDLSAKSQRRGGEPTSGRIWITAQPITRAGSAEVRFTDLVVTGDTDGLGGDMLLLIGQSQQVAPLIAEALTQNFSKDLAELETKIRRATAERQEGAFQIATRIDKIETGTIQAYGNGLYLPVRLIGAANIAYRPAPANGVSTARR